MTNDTPENHSEKMTPFKHGYQPVRCDHCERVFLVKSLSENQTCPLCQKGGFSPTKIEPAYFNPEKVLPFSQGPDHLSQIFTNYIKPVWFKPEELTTETLLSRTIPVFWPLWLVDCDINGSWQMDAGFDYQVESSQEAYVNGQWQSIKKYETRTRWEPRLGKLSTHIGNVDTPALKEHANRLQMTDSYPLSKAQTFDPQITGSALLEVPDLDPDQVWHLAKSEVDKITAETCQKAADAQHRKDVKLDVDYQNLNWTNFYLPLYATYYHDDDEIPQILIVNGQTGTIQGPRMASKKRGLRIAGKVAIAAGILFVLAIIMGLLVNIWQITAAFRNGFAFFGVLTAIAAIIIALWPSQWNNKQTGPFITDRKS